MARPQRSRDRLTKMHGLFGLCVSAVLLSSVASATRDLPLQAPILPPQVPLDGPEPPPPETHEFV